MNTDDSLIVISERTLELIEDYLIEIHRLIAKAMDIQVTPPEPCYDMILDTADDQNEIF